jgi:hypothetical protein
MMRVRKEFGCGGNAPGFLLKRRYERQGESVVEGRRNG